MQADDAIRIRHMIEAAEACERFATGRGRKDLESDLLLRFALIRAVEVIGEASSKVTFDTKLAIPDVPWPAIIAMRNRLIHAYFDIDLDVLWKTVTDEVPLLSAALRAALDDK